MWDIIHNEYKGPVGYSLTIVFYFACVAALFVLITFVVVPVAKSMRSHSGELTPSYMTT